MPDATKRASPNMSGFWSAMPIVTAPAGGADLVLEAHEAATGREEVQLLGHAVQMRGRLAPDGDGRLRQALVARRRPRRVGDLADRAPVEGREGLAVGQAGEVHRREKR